MTKNADKIILRLILLASICVLLIVFVAELMYGLEPCILCKYQRIPYFAAILFAGLALHIKTTNQQGTLRVIGIVFLISAFLAFYHYGVEQHWWNAATGCGNFNKLPISFENFQSQLMSTMPKKCDEIDWTLFGLSMTVYNIIVSVILGTLSFSSVLLSRKIRVDLN